MVDAGLSRSEGEKKKIHSFHLQADNAIYLFSLSLQNEEAIKEKLFFNSLIIKECKL